MSKLSGQDKNAIAILKKYGELMRHEDGRLYSSHSAFSSVDSRMIERLASEGYCRVDRIGETVLAVFLSDQL